MQSDIQTQARLTAASLAQNIQTGTKGAAEQFNRFIEGDNDGFPSSETGNATTGPRAGTGGRRAGGGGGNATFEPDRRDFWDSFGEEKAGGGFMGGGAPGAGKGGGGKGLLATSKAGRGNSAIGTAAMKKGNSTTTAANGTPGPGAVASGSGSAKEDNWEEW